MYHVTVQGVEQQIRFLKVVGCFGERGQIVPDLIEALGQIAGNPNTDVVPQEVWDLYGWATSIFEREWNYTISRTDDQSKKAKDVDKIKGERSKGKEIFILNYASSAQLAIF